MVLPVDEAVKVWTAKLEGVFHTKATDDTSKVNSGLYDAKNIYVCKNKVAKLQYLFRYSLEQTVSMIVLRHLKEQALTQS